MSREGENGKIMFLEVLSQECYKLIVNISSILAFYGFTLSDSLESQFQISKRLFYIGHHDDIPVVYFKLRDIESKLIDDIWEIYSKYGYCVGQLESDPQDVW